MIVEKKVKNLPLKLVLWIEKAYHMENYTRVFSVLFFVCFVLLFFSFFALKIDQGIVD